MARTGYKITVYLDDNPSSSGYMETYEERSYDSGACPISEDDLVLISNTCEIDLSGYTGYRILIYYNRTTGEYSSVREEDEECIPSSTEEYWVNSGNPYCETSEQGYNTGYMLQVQVQSNPNLENYGETRINRYKSPECGDNTCPIWDDIQRVCHVTLIDCAATFDGTADVTQIDVNPLSSTFNQTRTINIVDSGCTNCTSTEFLWGASAEKCGDDSIICSNGILVDKDGNTIKNTNKYSIKRRYKYFGTGNTIPMDEYSITLIEEDSEDCGYIRPQYRWDVVEGQFLCDYETYTKYQMKIKMVSYDSGATWSAVVPIQTERGDVIAYDSYDCGMPMYRWIPTGDQTCVDNEDDWKLKVTYSGGSEYIVPCNESATLTSDELSGISTNIVATSVDFGDCINAVSCQTITVNGSDNVQTTLHFGDYVESIGYGGDSSLINYGSSNFYLDENTFDDRLKTIKDWAFYDGAHHANYKDYCLFLKSNVESIGNYSFYPSYNGYLNTVLIDTVVPPTIQQYSFNGINAVFVPSGSVEAYKEVWSAYTNYIFSQAEEDTYFRATYSGGVQGWNFSDEGQYGVLTPEMTHATYKGRTISSITSVYLSDNITEIGASAFTPYQSTHSSGAALSLTSVSLPKNLATIGESAFGGVVNVYNSTGCSALTTVDTSRCERLTTIGVGAFNQCKSLSSITIPNTVTTIGDYAFGGCSGLTEIEIPNSVTTIGTYAFSSCSGLTNVTLPSGLTMISEGLFNKSTNLLLVRIPNSVSNVGERAFALCSKLVSVELPSGVTYIGIHAFITCANLTSVTIHATTPPVLGKVQNSDVVFNGTYCPVLVPSGSVDSYKSAWSSYADRIVAIGDYKFLSSYNDGTTYAVEEDGGTTLNTGITRGHSTSYQNMTTALISANINYIDDYSFSNCTSLHGITCLATTPPSLGYRALYRTLSTCPIYVPAASVNSYKSASGWSDYASRIQAIPT